MGAAIHKGPTSGPAVTLASRKTALPSGEVYEPFCRFGTGATAAYPAQASPFKAIPTFGGRAIPRWTRYGYWDEDGMTFTPTRVL